MDRWQAMRVFCGVVDAQGFTAAQDRLGMTHSTASRHVKWLESELGTQLLQRNSRGLSLTEAGRSYYLSCVQLLEQLDEAEAALAVRRARVAGVLRITLPLAVAPSSWATGCPSSSSNSRIWSCNCCAPTGWWTWWPRAWMQPCASAGNCRTVDCRRGCSRIRLWCWWLRPPI